MAETEKTKPETENPVQVLSDLKKIKELLRHIELVKDAARRIGEGLIEEGESVDGRTLIANSYLHDHSKFRGIEWEAIGSKECDNVDERKLAITQHVLTNSHHPEYWKSIHEMPRLLVYEMVCDWHARSTEFGTNLEEWITSTAMPKYEFNKNHKVWREHIRKALSLLLDKPFK